MKQDELFHVGKIVRTFGSKGEVVFQTKTDILTKIKKLESVFLKLNENLVPFFIEQMQNRPKNQALVKFMDIENSEDAAKLGGCEIYIPVVLIPKAKGSELLSHGIEGFRVIDRVFGDIGILNTILELPQQALLSIDFNGKEILVPVVEEIIKKIDRKNKVIQIDAPEGLIDLYIS